MLTPADFHSGLGHKVSRIKYSRKSMSYFKQQVQAACGFVVVVMSSSWCMLVPNVMIPSELLWAMDYCNGLGVCGVWGRFD